MSLQKLLLFLTVAPFILVAGEVNICLKLDSSSTDEASLEEVPHLLDEVSKQTKNIVDEFVGDSKPYDHFYLNLSHPAITVSANFSNGIVKWSKPSIKQWDFTPEGLEIFNITVNSFSANGTYDLYGHIGDELFDIFGNGTFSIEFSQFSVATFMGLKINKTALCIPVTVNIDLQKCKNNFGNLMNGEEELDPLVNTIFEKLIPEAVRIIWREDADAADSYIQSIIDKILNRSSSSSWQKLLRFFINNKDTLTSDDIDYFKNQF